MKKRTLLSILFLVFSLSMTQSTFCMFSWLSSKPKSKVTAQDLHKRRVIVSLELLTSCDPTALAYKAANLNCFVQWCAKNCIAHDVAAVEGSNIMKAIYQGKLIFDDGLDALTKEVYPKMNARSVKSPQDIKRDLKKSYDGAPQHINPHEETDAIIKMFDNIIIINNSTAHHYLALKKKIGFLQNNDFIVSCLPKIQALTSSKKFYETVLQLCEHNAKDCILLTSYQACADAAQQVGIQSIVFNDHNEFISNMREMCDT